jgi:hypothetical protein
MSPGELIATSAIDLKEKLDHHCRMVRAVFGITPAVEPACTRAWRLRLTIAEAIEVLDSTGSAFRSKQLEELRKKLIRALAESE